MSRYVRIAVCMLLMATLPLWSADVATGANQKKQNSLIDAPDVAIRKFTVAPGLKVDLFAAEPDVRNPVALSIDELGRVFVVESDRRRSSVFDIRGHKEWLDADFSFRTVQDRINFLKQQVSPTNPAAIKRLTGGGNGSLADFNQDGVIDWHDLEVQSERIRLLEDTDGDGRADRVSIFADGFTNIVAGVAAGVLAQRGDVYFACIPDLWRISKPVIGRSVISEAGRPSLNTGSLITESLITGFGVHIAFGGHDMHGLIFGPDGKLYWSIADRGTDTNLFAKIKNPIPGLTPELLADKSESLRIEAGRWQGGGGDAMGQWAKTLETGSIAEKQGVFASLATAKGFTAEALLAKQLDALIAGTLAKELTLDVLDAAKKNSSDAIVSRVKKYEASLPKNDALAPWRMALYGGNAEEGRKVFIENQNVACYRCHKINGEGGEVGSDLTGVGAKRGREYLLESIVFPNQEVAPGFEQALITLQSGTEYAGTVKSESDTEVVLNSPEDGLLTLKKADIKARQKGLSAMPEELGNVLTRRELRDVIEFLDAVK